MTLKSVLKQLEPLKKSGEITAWVHLESQPGSYEPLPDHIHRDLSAVLASRGIDRLYSHQATACRLASQGHNLVIVTPTASGKTLCYNLPILQSMLQDEDARALYLFPTKALAQDQKEELLALTRGLDRPIGVDVYDGDTPADRRRKIRQQARLILTNPDMLHSGILPHHPKWVDLFRNLKFVVVDELHTYRGVFGSQVANVFRRLSRIARFYNTDLQFLTCSATIANPGELASALLGTPVRTIERSGAPRASKDVILYNPPISNPDLGIRKSALSSARQLSVRFLKKNIQALVFATSRVNVEVLLRYLQGAIPNREGEPPKVRGYRGGYLPSTRREIERQLREKELLGVVSTNALELGIDIGSLDACVLAGYPGSVASTWQQIGRAGRRSGHSAAILIARNLPLDQFMVSCPEYFFEQSPEHGLVYPDHLEILVSHIKCAAFELPFQRGETFGGENLEEILDFLAEQNLLTRSGDRWHWSNEAYPADSVSLRDLSEENFVVFDQENENRAIAEVDFESAPELIHEQAIYLCEGRQYHVETLDYEGRKAYVRPVDVDYYTEAITHSRLKILSCMQRQDLPSGQVAEGEVHLVRKVPGFKKVKFYTRENLGYGPVNLPTQELHTTSFWLTIHEGDLLELGLSRSEIVQGCLGLSFALQHVARLALMCGAHDLGRTVGDRSTEWFAVADSGNVRFYTSSATDGHEDPGSLQSFDPTIFLYDNLPGGIGFSAKLFELHPQLFQQVRDLIMRCSCKHGCPSCVGPVNALAPGTRQAALRMARLLAPETRVH